MKLQLLQTLVQLMVTTLVSDQILSWKVAEELNLFYLVSWERWKIKA